MANFNRVFLMGNLTKDVDLRSTAGNQSVATVRLAVNRRYRTKDNEEREETTYVDCEAWGRQAEVMKQYLSKGRPVFIEGRLKLDEWEDQQGQTRSKLYVVVENFQFIGGPGGGGGGGSDGGESRRPASAGARGARGGDRPSSEEHVATPEEDIPF
jgi:single-strand DNA-binding protein